MSDLITPHLAYLRAIGRARSTVETRQYWLSWADRHLPEGIEHALPDELSVLIGRPDWSPSTRKACYNSLATFYRWATAGQRPHLSWNPCAGLIAPRVPVGVPRPVSDAELTYALARAEPPYDMAVLLAAYGGLRCCELCRITRADVSAEWLRIVGKGGKTRLVATHPLVWARVEPLPDGLLVVGRRGTVLRPRYLAQQFSAHMRAVGLVGPPRVTAHRFRHWFATKVQAGIGDLRVTQELLGHASPQTTAVYTAVADASKRNAVWALPELTDERRHLSQTTPPARATSTQPDTTAA